MAVKTVWALSSVMLVAYALHALFGLGGHRLDGFFLKWVTDAIALLSAAMCMWRAVVVRRTHAADKEVELVLSQGRLPVLVGDGGRLGQLLDNLISNALKFTPRKGRVTVRTGRNGDASFVEVEDTGTGISAADQERLFERFFRTTSATAQAIPGIGLGLSISQAIAEAHGGKIIVSSLLGVGTTFRFEAPLPLAYTELLPHPAALTAA